MSVRPIPPGQAGAIPYLVVRDAAAAIDWYKKVLGVTEVTRMPMPDGKTIMHAEVKLRDSSIFMTEEAPDYGARSPLALGGSPVTIHAFFEDVDAVFNRAVAAGATPTMPPMGMFWGDRYGRFTDPFGHSWSVATHQKDLSPQEMAAAAKEAFAQMGGSWEQSS
jgi:uncharacterized glyoxalase superfamily protein PhnB